MEKAGGSQLPAMKRMKKAGKPGRKPSLGWRCNVDIRIVGEHIPDVIVKSDYLRDNAGEITIGNGNWPLDKQIELCLQTMYLEEESSFELELEGSVRLGIEITLKDCVEKDYIFNWDDDEKLEMCKYYKADGVELFKGERIEHSFYKFSKALKMLLLMEAHPFDLESQTEEADLLLSLYNNLANCQFHFMNYPYVIELCNKSLGIKPNVKGFFRRALAYIELKDYEKAENDILELLKIEPKNKAAIEKYRLVRSLDKPNRDNYEAIVKKMFR